LLLELEREVKSVNGKFIVLFTKKKESKPFPNNNTYAVCISGKKFTYNNYSFDKKIERIFQNLENVFILDLKNYKKNYYDLFDGHYNKSANEFIMNSLHTYLKSKILKNQ
tara:strand:+ start:1001 stop:1330 length:330 start_codon:yes stop_codon:yes gene_type:complete